MRRLARMLASALLVLPLTGLAWSAGVPPVSADPAGPAAAARLAPQAWGQAMEVAKPLAAARSALDVTSPQRWQPWPQPPATVALGVVLAVSALALALAAGGHRAAQAWGPGWLPAERAPPRIA